MPLAAGLRSVPIIYACLFVVAFGRAFQWPARQALLAHIVPPEALHNAITWNSRVQEISSVSGPAGRRDSSGHHRKQNRLSHPDDGLRLPDHESVFFGLRYRSKVVADRPAPTAKSLLEGMHFVRENKLILSAISGWICFAVLNSEERQRFSRSMPSRSCMPARAAWDGCAPRLR